MHGSMKRRDPARILVMQDDFFLAEEIRNALEDARFEVVGPFQAWSEDLDAALKQRPDAAVLDMKMDQNEANGVLARLQALSIPLVMATGHANTKDAERFANCSVVEKPGSVSTVIAAVQTALRITPRVNRSRAAK